MRTSRTNTPLQALALLNEVTYVEAARMLAQRAMHAAQSPNDRIVLAFRLALARAPSDAERDVLAAAYERYRAEFAGNPQAAVTLLAVGEAPRDPSLYPAELAACTAVANLILNLDEVVTKE